jgi:tetratricopeptide (TPR) repeat protein
MMRAGCCRSRVLFRTHQCKNPSDNEKVNRLDRVLGGIGATFVSLLLALSIASSAQVSNSGESKPTVPETVAAGSSGYRVSVAQLSVPAKAGKHLEVAQQRFSKRDLLGATREIDRALQIDPLYARAYSMRSFVKLAANDPSGAVADAVHAAELESHDAQSYLALATAYNSLGEFHKAAEAARQALSIRSDTWQARLEMAKSLYGQGQYLLALSVLDMMNVDFPDVHLVRADVLMCLGRSREAVEQFTLFLKQAPNDGRGVQIREIVASARQPFLNTNLPQK